MKRNIHHRELVCNVLNMVERAGRKYGDSPNYTYKGIIFGKAEWETTRAKIIKELSP